MRTAEEEMLNAEKWSSLAWLDGLNYPSAELTEDWKKVLFNQFHDLAAGSGIADIYKDAQKDYAWVRMSTNEIDANAMQAVFQQVNTVAKDANIVPILVFNPMAWERSGQVKAKVQLAGSPIGLFVYDESRPDRKQQVRIVSRSSLGVEFTFDATDVPPLGYKVYQFFTTPTLPTIDVLPADLKATAFTLENDNFRVLVDKSTGCITSIFDKRSRFEELAPNTCGNELQAFGDTPKQYDAWNIDPGTLDQPPATITATDSVKEFRGFSMVSVTRSWQNSKFVQTISLDGDLVDIDNDIDWHEKHVLLKAAFPLAVTSDFATYEIPYGSIERPTTRNNSFEKAQFEVPAMRWADLSGAGSDGKVHGLSILNQDKYGYDAAGNVLRITLLRSPTWPDPDADQGEHHFHYALYPHAGTWKDALTVRHGWEYDYPLQAVVTTAHAGSLPPEHSLASVEPDNIVLTAVKKAEDQNGQGVNGLIFRAYEWAGKETTAEFHVPPGATGATVTNLMEQPEGGPRSITTENGANVVKVPIHPYEILTIRVDYATAGDKGPSAIGN
jgi:alpha-mannosidase